MNKQDAEKVLTEYLKPIFGFALKRCKSLQDAEDLSQEIALKAFRAITIRDDIADIGKFIWAIAHNTLSNYYRNSAKGVIGMSIDEMADLLADPDSELFPDDTQESIARLQNEIAYLSKQQRRIVIAYYFENRKQADIAKELGIPLGTVKWHLFEAKKELKRGMDIMRKSSDLKFNPIKFNLCGFNGSTGTKGSPSNFFRSAISQNIEYSVLREPKTVNEIADALGVSPVYVESEAEYLEEYGFLIKKGDKYLCNILLDEPTNEIIRLHDEMYTKAAKLFANELYDELTTCKVLDDSNIWGGNTEPFTMTHTPPKDKNFMLWALIPYIAALSGEALMDNSISFEEACTIRPDGGKNILYASVLDPNVTPPMYFKNMKQWCGPCWNGLTDKIILWTIDSEWSEKRITENYQSVVVRDLSLLDRFLSDLDMSNDEYAYLIERGYISVIHEPYDSFKNSKDWTANLGDNIAVNYEEGCTKTTLRCLYLSNKEIRDKLISIGDCIREKHKEEFDALKAPYIKAVLNSTPKHLHKMQKYGLQYIFYSDGWFLLHCLKELVTSGKLKEPSEGQKKSLTTIIVPNK